MTVIRPSLVAVCAALLVASAGATVLVSVEEALAMAFPGATTARETLFLTDEQMEEASVLSGVELESALVTRYAATDAGGALVGHAYLDTHRVRTLPETLMIVVGPDGTLGRVEVVVFREPVEYMPREGGTASTTVRSWTMTCRSKGISAPSPAPPSPPGPRPRPLVGCWRSTGS